jgi:cytochrome c
MLLIEMRPGRELRGKAMQFLFWCFVLGTFLSHMSAGSAADIDAGKAVFKKCALCHTDEPGKNKIGPSLFGIVGRKSASLTNYNYSDAMKGFDHTWDPQTLDTYLTDPHAIIPGTKMIFPGLKDKADRDNLIAYLESLK